MFNLATPARIGLLALDADAASVIKRNRFAWMASAGENAGERFPGLGGFQTFDKTADPANPVFWPAARAPQEPGPRGGTHSWSFAFPGGYGLSNAGELLPYKKHDVLDPDFAPLRERAGSAGGGAAGAPVPIALNATAKQDEFSHMLRNYGGAKFPEGTDVLLQSSTRHGDHWKLVAGVGGPLVADHLSGAAPEYSRHVFEMTGVRLDEDRHAGLHGPMRVRMDDIGVFEVARNYTSAPDGAGFGFGVWRANSAKIQGPTRTGGSPQLVQATDSQELSGPLFAGHPSADQHLHGKSKDGATNAGHIHTSAYFTEGDADGNFDGPLHFYRRVYPKVAKGPFRLRVFLYEDRSLTHDFHQRVLNADGSYSIRTVKRKHKWDWWTGQFFCPPQHPPFNPGDPGLPPGEGIPGEGIPFEPPTDDTPLSEIFPGGNPGAAWRQKIPLGGRRPLEAQNELGVPSLMLRAVGIADTTKSDPFADNKKNRRDWGRYQPESTVEPEWWRAPYGAHLGCAGSWTSGDWVMRGARGDVLNAGDTDAVLMVYPGSVDHGIGLPTNFEAPVMPRVEFGVYAPVRDSAINEGGIGLGTPAQDPRAALVDGMLFGLEGGSGSRDGRVFWRDASGSSRTGRLNIEGNLTVDSAITTGIADTQVVYSASGVLSGDAGMTYDAANDRLNMPGIGINAGIMLGGDARLYRDIANTLRMATDLRIDQSLGLGTAAPGVVFSGQGHASNRWSAVIDGSTGGLFAGALQDVQWYRDANGWRTPNNVLVDNKLTVGSIFNPARGKTLIAGVNASAAGPHSEWITNADAYPQLQVLAWAHNNVALTWDGYYTGSFGIWNSSSATGSFQWYKTGSAFALNAGAAAAGSALTWVRAMSVSNTAGLRLGAGTPPASGVSVSSDLTCDAYIDMTGGKWIRWDGLEILARSGNDVHFRTNHATGQFLFEAESPPAAYLSLIPGTPAVAQFGVQINSTQNISMSAGRELHINSVRRLSESAGITYLDSASGKDAVVRANGGSSEAFRAYGSGGGSKLTWFTRVGPSVRAVSNGDFSAGHTSQGEVFLDASAETFAFYSAGTLVNRISMIPGTESVHNEQGKNIDWRAEGDTRPNLFLIDASRDDVKTDGGRRVRLETISANTTLRSTHHIVHVDTRLGSVTVTLPAASSNAGQVYVIKHGDSGAASGNSCRLSRSGADTIDVSLATLAVTWGTTTVVVSDGTSTWRVLGSSY